MCHYECQFLSVREEVKSKEGYAVIQSQWSGVSLVNAKDGNVEELVGEGRAGVEVLHVLAAVPGDVSKEHDGLENKVNQRQMKKNILCLIQ